MDSGAMKTNENRVETDPELFMDLINKSNDAIYVVDPPTGRFILANDKACVSLGYERRELLKMDVMDIETSLSDKLLWQTHVNELRHKGSLIFEGVHKRKNGAAFPVEANISYVALNTREYLVTVVRDITERRRMESEMRLHSEITGNICEGIYLVSKNDLKIVYANPKMEEMFGYDRGEMTGEHVSIINAPNGGDPAATAGQIEKALKETGTWRGEVYNIRKDGTTFWGNSSISMLHHPEYGEVYLSLQTDITERKKIERALRESEERYKAIVESQAEFVVRYMPGGILTFVNDTLCRYLGLRREDLIGKSYYPFMHADDREPFIRKIEALHRAAPVMLAEARVVLPDGRVAWHRWTHHAIFDDLGCLVEYQSSGRDVTELREAEEELRLSEARFRTLAEAAFEAIAVTEEGILLDANRQLCDMVGYSLDELRRAPVMNIIAPEDRELVRHNQSTGYEAPYENRLLHKGGSIIVVESRARHFMIKNRTVRVTVLRDITGRKMAEEDLLKTQKLESLGILAGGIAHDFNNILTAILGNISLARMDTKSDAPQFRWLREAERASYHARELTQQLLTFAKGGAPVKSTVSLEHLVRDSAGFAMRGSNVRCDFRFGEDLLPVDVDAGQMGQVFNNLLINACQATPEGGTIKIDAQNVDIRSAEGMPLPEGKYVKISIRDHGTGIPEEHLQRIFDPYFTTKQKGSGLGLSIVHSVIRNHSGNITVESRLGVGTTFIIYLPASTEKVVRKELKGEAHIPGRGRVLLMDDEEIVRKVSGEILKEMGYEVELASDGEEAIRLYKTAMASSRPFDAVIMDLTVPGGMGGKEAIQKLREADPEVKAVVSSGYSQDPIMARYKEYGFCEVIAKPFSSIELGQIMRKVIVKR
jgi:PAS domain S-box-containing protein